MGIGVGAALAIGAGAGASAGASIFSGIMGSSTAKKSAAAMRYTADQARDTALKMDDRARADVAPFRQMGVDAGSTLMGLLTGDEDLDAILKESSLFKFESELGHRNINRELSARGLYGSGAGLETLARFNNQLVAEEGTRFWDRLFNVTSLGANAASHMATNTSETGRSIADLQLRGGVAAAGMDAEAGRSIAGIGPGVADAVSGGIGNYTQYQLYKPVLDRFSSGGRSRDPVFDSVDSPSMSTFSGR